LDIHPLAASERGRYLADWAAVQQADALVSEVIEQITQTFTNEHSSLKNQWNQGNDISTEDSARICSATAPSSTVWWFENRRSVEQRPIKNSALQSDLDPD
jgi:hypothetical protein